MCRLYLTGSFCIALLIGAGTMQADITSYTDPGVFAAAAPGVVTQTFGPVAANLGVVVGGLVGINNPLNNTTNSGMLPGLEIDATTNTGNDLVVAGPNLLGFGTTNYSVVGNFQDGLNFTFGGGVTAASLDVISIVTGNPTVTAYDPNGNLLGTFTVPNAPDTGSGEFIGFTTGGGDTIGSLDLTKGSVYVAVDQVQFGNASGAATPEPSFFALTGLGFAGFVTFAVRRRRKLTA